MAPASSVLYLMRQRWSWGILMLGNVAFWCSGHSSTFTGTVSLSPHLSSSWVHSEACPKASGLVWFGDHW